MNQLAKLDLLTDASGRSKCSPHIPFTRFHQSAPIISPGRFFRRIPSAYSFIRLWAFCICFPTTEYIPSINPDHLPPLPISSSVFVGFPTMLPLVSLAVLLFSSRVLATGTVTIPDSKRSIHWGASKLVKALAPNPIKDECTSEGSFLAEHDGEAMCVSDATRVP